MQASNCEISLVENRLNESMLSESEIHSSSFSAEARALRADAEGILNPLSVSTFCTADLTISLHLVIDSTEKNVTKIRNTLYNKV